MKVKDVMTKNVTFVNPTTTISETAQLMQMHNVGAIPVCDQSGLLGMITDRDIVIRTVAHGKSPQQTQVKDVMTSSVTTVTPDMDMDDVAKRMACSQIRRLPVIENNTIVGIVSLGDIAIDAKYDTEVADTLIEISKPTLPQ